MLRLLTAFRSGASVGLALFTVATSFWIPVANGAKVSLEDWPRVVLRDGATNTIYQPQLESWDYVTLKATCAVSIQRPGTSQPAFGRIEIRAKTRVDRAEREVFFETIEVTNADFPSAGDQAKEYQATLQSLVPKEVKGMALDHLEASLAILEAREHASGHPLRNEPPAIMFSTKPALLVPVDGPAVYRPVERTELERVLNTRALILRDKAGKHYLHLFDGYLEAPGLNGPWTVCGKVPGDVKRAEKKAVERKQVDLLAGQPSPKTRKLPSLKTEPVPDLHVTFVPTELIVTTGEPLWSPLPPTHLLYVTNTTAHVFKELNDQQTYVLVSGRWFRSPSFGGPWEFVPAANLPKDFAAIPDESPAENVKASVPGTPQAKETAIANSIPHTVKVDREKARIEPPPQYDGPPQLNPIDGTPLSYIANSAIPVLKVDAKTWYACQNGIWFVATAPDGPWTVATSVPAVVYSIPASSPMHYVVYVRIYSYDPHFVWLGTTPGYYGTVVSADGVVVYGTGYAYPPYVGSNTYVSYSITYGYGANPCWTPWAGWAFGFAAGWAMADDWSWWCGCPPAPFWGPYWYPCYGAYYNAYGGITAWGPYGWAGTSGYVYHQNGPWTGVSRGAAGYNAWTGNQWATTYGRAYNSSTGTRVAGQRGAVENVYTGNYAYGGRGVGYNQNTGRAATGRQVTWGNVDTGNQSTAGRATIYNPNTGNTTHISGAKGVEGGLINVNGHVIAGQDGNYYRPDGNHGWEQVTKPAGGAAAPTSGMRSLPEDLGGQTAWHPVQPSNANERHLQSLNNEFNARRFGALRQQSFQMNRPTFRGGGFGGFRGGFRR